MKIFFSMRHTGAIRNFASTVRALTERGHDIHLAFVRVDKLGAETALWDLTDAYPNITHSDPAVKNIYRFWLLLARGVRFWTDFLRHLDPAYRDADKLRERAENRLRRFLVRISRLPLVGTPARRRCLAALLRQIERAIPTDPWVDAIIAAEKPDVVLVTPLVDTGSDQVDYVKSARGQGLRTGLCVLSWDNLSTKGLVRIPPDRVYVWDVPATPLLADGIEELGQMPRPSPRRTPAWLFPLRWLLVPAAAGLNVSRKFGCTSRERARQLHPLTVVGFILKPLSFVFDLFLRWRPVKSVVLQHVVPKAAPRTNPYLPAKETVTVPHVAARLSCGSFVALDTGSFDLLSTIMADSAQ